MSEGDHQRTILVTGVGVVPLEACQLIEGRGFSIRTVPDEHVNGAELHDALRGVSGYLIGGYEEPTAAHFEQAIGLEAVGCVGTDFRGSMPGWRRAFELGIAVVSAPGENAVSVVEFTILLMLALARPFNANLTAAQETDDEAPRAALPAPVGVELCGRSLGIVGAGRIGAGVARAAALGLGMRVRYAGPRRNPALEAAIGLQHVDMDALLEASDVISLHRPSLASGEKPTIGRRELERVKQATMLVNAGHPGLVDPVALGWAMEHKDVRAAFDGVGDDDVWKMLASFGPHRFLAVPQMGFLTRDANLRAAMRAAGAVCDVLSGVDTPSVNNQDYRQRRRYR
jgi:phosphoglycerate dehydrogenase-like enzyme